MRVSNCLYCGDTKEMEFKEKTQTCRILDNVEATLFHRSALGRCEQAQKLASAPTSQE